MQPGHLLHSALTHPSNADARRLKSRHPCASAVQQLISSSDNNNIRAVHWADHQWNAEWADNPTRHRIFIPDTGTHLPVWPFQEEPGPGLTTSTLVSDFSAPVCTNGVWPLLRPVNVAQKNKLSAMLSSNVQSIDLPMDCTAWRFWTMWQSNGCSTSTSRTSAAKQWLEQLAQKKKKLMWVIFFVTVQGRSRFFNSISLLSCRATSVTHLLSLIREKKSYNYESNSYLEKTYQNWINPTCTSTLLQARQKSTNERCVKAMQALCTLWLLCKTQQTRGVMYFTNNDKKQTFAAVILSGCVNIFFPD